MRDAGIKIQVGGHGQLQGLGTVWEMWMLTQGGMTPWEALRAGTIDGADYIGYSQDLGSLEAGKRADLVIVNGNPLENIQATADTAMVMINGRLFDTSILLRMLRFTPTHYSLLPPLCHRVGPIPIRRAPG